MKSKIHEIIALVVLIHSAPFACSACGPYFPNTFLDQGDDAMLAAPILNFDAELKRMDLPAPHFFAVPPTNSNAENRYSFPHADNYAEQSRDTDLADLRAALAAANISEPEREKILVAQGKARQKLQDYLDELGVWNLQHAQPWMVSDNDPRKVAVRPKLEGLEPPEGLPKEFEEYFRGLIAWRQNNTNEARTAWQALLALPESERRYRTTWADFMLGRSFAAGGPDKAIEYFQHVRQFAKQGFSDPLGLAESSLGWEARIYLKQNNFERAFDLYLQQYAAGEPTALDSLRFTAKAALHADATILETLAKVPSIRRVITAYVIGSHQLENYGAGVPNSSFGPWLHALDGAGIENVEEAEQLALAAYQNGNMELAQRWINHSLSAPLSQWLQAKLYLRAGKPDRAATILAHLTALFPVANSSGSNSPTKFEDGLYVNFYGYWPNTRSLPDQMLGEFGVLHLARREYRESLDCLLRSDYWMDAAYVADSVLTVDELKTYVDQNWTEDSEEIAKENANAMDGEYPVRWKIRNLLARRLTCLGRGHEARPYFPPDQQTNLDRFLSNWDAGNDQSRSAADRAHALFEAAKVARNTGMDLMGTELYPDWHIHDGGYDCGITGEARAGLGTNLLRPTADELDRCKSNHPEPDFRFHYRYVAASIAWQAAALMPNNSDETAKVLYTAGCWLKDRDPKNADRFYKSLVRRCRKTALGEEADRIRWFPKLDESGNIIPGKTRRNENPAPPLTPPDKPPAAAQEPPRSSKF